MNAIALMKGWIPSMHGSRVNEHDVLMKGWIPRMHVARTRDDAVARVRIYYH